MLICKKAGKKGGTKMAQCCGCCEHAVESMQTQAAVTVEMVNIDGSYREDLPSDSVETLPEPSDKPP